MLRLIYYELLFQFPVKMWQAAFLIIVTSFSSNLARPNLKPLSIEMVNYINKLNTTWMVSFSFAFPLNSLLHLLININFAFAPGRPKLP